MSEREQPANSDQTLTFESALERLEQIVHELEDGQHGLSESLEKYEQGVSFLKQCYAALEQADRKIELLTGVDSSGEATTESFDDEALNLEEKRQARGRRRSRKPNPPDEPLPADTDTQPGLF